MLVFTHLLIGAAIGKYFQNLWLVIPIALFSHYVLDIIPHYTMDGIDSFKENGFRGVNKKELINKSFEPLLGITLTLYLIYTQIDLALPMIIGAFCSWLPDIFIFLNWKYNIKIATLVHKTESRFHRHTTFTKGIIPQIVVALIAIILIIH